MRTSLVAAAGFAMALASATPSWADLVAFDPNGGGNYSVVFDSLDWQQGNSLLIEKAADPVTGANATIYFHSNLNSALLSGSQVFVNGTGGNFFTAVATFEAVFNTATGDFDLLTGAGSGAFAIYSNSVLADDLSGTNFTQGTPIIVGTTSFGDGSVEFQAFSGAQAIASFCPAGSFPAGTRCLDQFVDNDYPGIYTLRSTGGSHVEVTITDYDTNYFGNLIGSITLGINDSNNNLPFAAVDPSASFDVLTTNGTIGGTVDTGDVLGATNPNLCGPVVGVCINGTGDVIMTQTDLTTTFLNTANIVPEPASLTLLGLGLVGAAARRRKKAAK